MAVYQLRADKSPGSWLECLNTAITTRDHSLVMAPGLTTADVRMETLRASESCIGLCTRGRAGISACHWLPKSRLLANATVAAAELGLRAGQVVLVIAEPWHISGLTWLLACAQIGAKVRLQLPGTRDAQRWIEHLADDAVDCLVATPGVLADLIDAGGSWHVPRLIVTGGRLGEAFRSHLPYYTDDVAVTYGQTEAGGLVSFHRCATTNLPSGLATVCGHAIPGADVRTDGDPSLPGRVLIRSRYGRNLQWYDSDDDGYIDENGRLNVTERPAPVAAPNRTILDLVRTARAAQTI